MANELWLQHGRPTDFFRSRLDPVARGAMPDTAAPAAARIWWRSAPLTGLGTLAVGVCSDLALEIGTGPPHNVHEAYRRTPLFGERVLPRLTSRTASCRLPAAVLTLSNMQWQTIREGQESFRSGLSISAVRM